MKKVLLFLTVAFLCSSSSFSQARRQSQAKTAKTQQSYTKRVTSHTANWLVTLPNAKFSEANLQTLYNKAARIYAQKKHDRHFNGHEANEMFFLFCSSVHESQYNKNYEKVMDISPKDFASVVSPVFLQFLKLKRIQQPSTGKGWVKTGEIGAIPPHLETVKNRSLEAKNDRKRAEKTEYIRSTVAKTS